MESEEDHCALAELRNELMRYENQYGMSSSEFHARYQRGEMGDSIEAVEWNAFYKMYLRLAAAISEDAAQ